LEETPHPAPYPSADGPPSPQRREPLRTFVFSPLPRGECGPLPALLPVRQLTDWPGLRPPTCRQKAALGRMAKGHGPAGCTARYGPQAGEGSVLKKLTVISHHVLTRLEGRGFSPAEIASAWACLPPSPSCLRPQAARGAGHGIVPQVLVAAGLKPRPSVLLVRNPG
jgi:hypothetical protein